ncbi:hypothetical protein SAMN05443247_01458 [Bradyrhizobium erythrophlei]|nr:hypothetical protein SAMN05443247_01458 [Bradyrhizobium erythrophlei]
MGGPLQRAAILHRAAVGRLGILAFLQGCTTTPSIETETRAVPISEIVERVKCEIWDATKERLADPDFAFLKKWDATVDLTLMINDLSGISPGVSAINPLKTVILPGKGTFNQSFSLGLGGGVTGQANLSDTVSFSLSLSELAYKDHGLNNPYLLKDYYHLCEPLQENDLIGRLRFKEWIDQALSPVHDPENGFHYLTRGVHPSVKGVPSPAKIKIASQTAYKQLDQEKEKLKLESVPQTEDTKRKSESVEDIKQKISPEQLTQHPEVIDELIAQHQNDTDQTVVNILKDLRTKVTAAKKTPPKPPKMNDPVDTISHQIQFIVNWNASVTPSWTLVNVKAPAPAVGSFLSAQRQTTHQLLITMGPVKADVQSVRQYQQFNAALQRVTIPIIPQ